MIQAVEQGLQVGYPLDAEAVLIIELDGLAASMDYQVNEAVADHGQMLALRPGFAQRGRGRDTALSTVH